MARPGTILQVVPALETGGVERTALDVAAAVVRAGGRPIVVSEGGRMLDELRALGGEHVAMPVATKNPVAMRRNARRLADLLEREAVDVVHARSRAPAWSALWAARWSRRPFVTTYHGIYNERSWLKNRYNSVMARGDAVIANSGYTAAIVAERHPFARGRIVTIHRGIDVARFAGDAGGRAVALRAAWGVGPDERVVLHLARLTAWKGQEVVLDALALLRDRLAGVVVVFAGDEQGRTGYRARLEARIAALGIGAHVRIVGHVDDVPGALAASAVAVQPSTDPEAFGRAAVEAQAAGVPVVVSDHGATAETVLAGAADRTGWRVPPGDAAALAAALAEALDAAPAERAAIGARGRAHAAANFSLAAMTEKTLAVYGALLDNRGRALY